MKCDSHEQEKQQKLSKPGRVTFYMRMWTKKHVCTLLRGTTPSAVSIGKMPSLRYLQTPNTAYLLVFYLKVQVPTKPVIEKG